MLIVNIIAGLILFFSFAGGMATGFVKTFFSFFVSVLAIPIAGRFYLVTAGWLGFLSDDGWKMFVGFMIAWALASIVLSLILVIPRKLFEKVWPKDPVSRLLGGLVGLLNSVIGIIVMAMLFNTYPVVGWMQENFVNAGIVKWLVNSFGFVQGLLPEIMRWSGG